MADSTEPDKGDQKPLDDRVSALETRQDSMAGKIDQILGIVSKTPDQPTDPPAPTDPPPVVDIQAQMEAAIRKVNAETPPPAPDKPTPETPPREAGQPFRERLAQTLYGRDKR